MLPLPHIIVNAFGGLVFVLFFCCCCFLLTTKIQSSLRFKSIKFFFSSNPRVLMMMHDFVLSRCKFNINCLLNRMQCFELTQFLYQFVWSSGASHRLCVYIFNAPISTVPNTKHIHRIFTHSLAVCSDNNSNNRRIQWKLNGRMPCIRML